MNNLFDEYSSTIRKAGQLLKIISCKHSIFQPMALFVGKSTSHFSPSRVRPHGFFPGSVQAEAALQSSLRISPWLFCPSTLHSSHHTAPISSRVFAGTDPPGCTELSKRGSTDTLHLRSRHRAVLPEGEDAGANVCDTISCDNTSSWLFLRCSFAVLDESHTRWDP